MAAQAAAYDLEHVKALVRVHRYVFTKRVQRHMRRAHLSERDFIECALRLSGSDFHKSLSHDERPGIWLDVYRPLHRGVRMYLKITYHENADDILVLSFCYDGTAH